MKKWIILASVLIAIYLFVAIRISSMKKEEQRGLNKIKIDRLKMELTIVKNQANNFEKELALQHQIDSLSKHID